MLMVDEGLKGCTPIDKQLLTPLVVHDPRTQYTHRQCLTCSLTRPMSTHTQAQHSQRQGNKTCTTVVGCSTPSLIHKHTSTQVHIPSHNREASQPREVGLPERSPETKPHAAVSL